MFLDIGAGILLAIASAHSLHIEITTTWICAALFFVLLPDIDMIIYGVERIILNKKPKDHRSWTHYPILYLPATFLLYLISPSYSLLFFLCIYFHALHDTVWLGWGMSWLWPFSDRKFKFFPDKDGVISSQVLLTWKKDEEEKLFRIYNNPTWVRDFYLRPNIVAYTEYGVFIIAIIALLYI